jgi:hypothetical protein
MTEIIQFQEAANPYVPRLVDACGAVGTLGARWATCAKVKGMFISVGEENIILQTRVNWF